jgi:hypothetical protein
MINNSHATNFPLKHAWKDMRFAIDMAKSLDVDCSKSKYNSFYVLYISYLYCLFL